jgi:hypothetical protein
VQACIDQGALFAALLEWGARSFMSQDGWPELSVGEKHAVVWCYADQLTGLIGSLGLEAKDIAEHFKKQLGEPAARSLTLERGYDDSPLRAGILSQVGIMLAGLEYGLGAEADNIKPTEEQMGRLARTATIHNDLGEVVPRPERALSFLSTPFPTWVSRPTPDAVIENGGRAEQTLTNIVDGLEKDPNDPKLWEYLLVFGRPALRPELSNRLQKIVESVDLEKVLSRDDDPLFAIRKIAEVSSRLVGQTASDQILNKLFALSRSWLSDSNEPEFKKRLEALIEAGASAARTYDGNGSKRLSWFLRALLANIAGVAPVLRPILDALIDQTRVTEAGEFWTALMAARAG